jgi:hypothetical protein
MFLTGRTPSSRSGYPNVHKKDKFRKKFQRIKENMVTITDWGLLDHH